MTFFRSMKITMTNKAILISVMINLFRRGSKSRRVDELGAKQSNWPHDQTAEHNTESHDAQLQRLDLEAFQQQKRSIRPGRTVNSELPTFRKHCFRLANPGRRNAAVFPWKHTRFDCARQRTRSHWQQQLATKNKRTNNFFFITFSNT